MKLIYCAKVCGLFQNFAVLNDPWYKKKITSFSFLLQFCRDRAPARSISFLFSTRAEAIFVLFYSYTAQSSLHQGFIISVFSSCMAFYFYLSCSLRMSHGSFCCPYQANVWYSYAHGLLRGGIVHSTVTKSLYLSRSEFEGVSGVALSCWYFSTHVIVGISINKASSQD